MDGDGWGALGAERCLRSCSWDLHRVARWLEMRTAKKVRKACSGSKLSLMPKERFGFWVPGLRLFWIGEPCKAQGSHQKKVLFLCSTVLERGQEKKVLAVFGTETPGKPKLLTYIFLGRGRTLKLQQNTIFARSAAK